MEKLSQIFGITAGNTFAIRLGFADIVNILHFRCLADRSDSWLQLKMDHVEYMRLIGAKGGSKRADNPKRVGLAKKAARASWSESARAKRAAKISQNKSLTATCTAAMQ